MAQGVVDQLKTLNSLRQEQQEIIKKIGRVQRSLKRKRSESEDPVLYHEISAFYKQAFVRAAEELRIAFELGHKIAAWPNRKEREAKEREKREKDHKDLKEKDESARKLRATEIANDSMWIHNQIVLPARTPVAALTDQHSNPKLWILASVLRYLPDRERYIVVDEDPGDENNPKPLKKKYTLDAYKLIPIPTIKHYPWIKKHEFKRDQRILAIFPRTTVFYPCTVVEGPKRRKDNSYVLMFDEDDEKETIVDARYCLPLLPRFYSQEEMWAHS